MKKFSFAIPILFLSTILNFSLSTVEAAGCNSHKNKSLDQECLKEDLNCRKGKVNENLNKVDV
tara:strand:+ start:20568 stop:20756 length:189 start_codon:yes stop_codon:yes gene_type:complete